MKFFSGYCVLEKNYRLLCCAFIALDIAFLLLFRTIDIEE